MKHAVLLALAFAGGAAVAAQQAPERPVLRVAPGGGADHETIQAALDAAPAGARVEVAAGTYRERLTIRRAVELVGAGALETVVEVPFDNPLARDPAVRARFDEALGRAAPDERAAVRARLLRELGPQPVLAVEGTDGVVIRGVQCTLPGESEDGVVVPGAVVRLCDGSARVLDCAIVGAPCSGVVITGDGVVELRGCLVAAVDATGVHIDGAVGGAAPHVAIVDCDVRGCRHRGITIGRGNASATISGCRISGSLWHGIRYDDCAPTISGNLVFDNERSGIYASGSSAGTVSGNVFFDNGHGAISCWFASRDRVQGNTFVVGRARAGVSLCGAAAPRLEQNLFFGGAVAIALADVADDRPDALATGTVDLVDNAFAGVETRVSWRPAGAEEEVAAAFERGNRDAEAAFVDEAGRDFRQADHAPLRAAGIGAVRAPSPVSPWPVLPAERVEGR